MSDEWREWNQVTEYVPSGHKLYRSSSPNYLGNDITQMLTSTAVKHLADQGIDSIISFNRYPYIDSEKQLLVDANISYLHLPVKDFSPPTLAQLESAIAFFNDPQQHSTLIHCGFGHGRTGTAVTALQLSTMLGIKPTEKEWEENHVETPEQMAVLRQFRDQLTGK